MINYTFEVIADMGHGSHVHGEIQVGLSAAEVDVIISYMKEFGEVIDFDSFHNKYPELDDKINQAAQEEIPDMLEAYYYTVEDMEFYWWEFPYELKDIAVAELGHPLYHPEPPKEKEESEGDEDAFDVEQWIKDHAQEIMDFEEDMYQERKEKFLAEHPNEENGYEDEAFKADAQPDNTEYRVEIYDVTSEMDRFEDQIIDVTYMSYSRFSDDEVEKHYIGQVGQCTEWGLLLEHPMDPKSRSCIAGSCFSPVHAFSISPVSQTDIDDWRRAAHEHSDLCRRCDKEDWVMDHPEYEGIEFEQEKAYRYIDSAYDLVNAKIDEAIPYQGPKESYLRL